jgi:hypothetical protein
MQHCSKFVALSPHESALFLMFFGEVLSLTVEGTLAILRI